MAKRGEYCERLACFYSPCVAERHDRDEEELVPLCVGEYEGLKDAFMLQGGASMRVKHIRSYSVAELQEHVQGWEWLEACPCMA